MELVDYADAGHHRSAVGDGKAFADMHLERFKAVFFHHLCGRSPLTFIVDFAFADETKCDMGQLHQVATGAYAAMHGNERIYLAVDELNQQFHYIGMHTRTALQHRAEAGYHGRLHIDIIQGLSCSCRVATNDIIL